MEGEGAMERRIRIVGLCLIAVFALSAVIATAAQAETQFGQCVKTLKVGKVYKGQYTNKECTAKATPEEEALGGKTNKYKWEGGPGHKATFLAKGKTVTIMVGAVEVSCKKSSGLGTVRNSQNISATLTFTTCTQPKNENEKCQTPKAESGEIETKELIGTVVEKPSKEVLISYERKVSGNEGNPEEPWMEFTCFGRKFTITGTLAVKATTELNKMSKRGGIKASATEGEQGLEASFINPVTLETEEEPLTLSLESAFKFENLIELRQV
jgi:hypothetical protein